MLYGVFLVFARRCEAELHKGLENLGDVLSAKPPRCTAAVSGESPVRRAKYP